MTGRTRASFDPCLLCIPKLVKFSFFERSCMYAAPILWNAFDLDIRLLHFDVLCKLLLIIYRFIVSHEEYIYIYIYIYSDFNVRLVLVLKLISSCAL